VPDAINVSCASVTGFTLRRPTSPEPEDPSRLPYAPELFVMKGMNGCSSLRIFIRAAPMQPWAGLQPWRERTPPISKGLASSELPVAKRSRRNDRSRPDGIVEVAIGVDRFGHLAGGARRIVRDQRFSVSLPGGIEPAGQRASSSYPRAAGHITFGREIAVALDPLWRKLESRPARHAESGEGAGFAPYRAIR